MKISKSKFMAGVQCLKRLYFEVHEPGLVAWSDGANQAIIEQGQEVGLLARQLFPGGVEVCRFGWARIGNTVHQRASRKSRSPGDLRRCL